MREGHPYLTDQLDSKRVEQRRLLRSIPDYLLSLDNIGPSGQAVEAILDRPYVEGIVREKAQSLLDARTRDQFDQWDSAAAEERFVQFLQYEVVRRPGSRIDYVWPDAVRAVAPDSLAVLHNPREIDENVVARLRPLILLLVLADDIADDGYVDPRLAA